MGASESTSGVRPFKYSIGEAFRLFRKRTEFSAYYDPCVRPRGADSHDLLYGEAAQFSAFQAVYAGVITRIQ